MEIINFWKRRGNRLKELYTMFLALSDYRVPWQAKAAVVFVILYALLPLDIFPEYIPLAGLIDDLLLATLGISWAMKMIPEPVLEECRERARTDTGKLKRLTWTLVGLLIIWLGLIIYAIIYLAQRLN